MSTGIKATHPPVGAIPVKEAEKYLGEFVNYAVYAVLADSDEIADLPKDNPRVKDPLMFQHYANLLRIRGVKGNDKIDKGLSGLATRFTISSEMRQILAIIFIKIVAEFKEIVLNDKSTVDTVVENLNEALVECYTAHIFKFAKESESKMSKYKTLTSMTDDNDWFAQQAKGQLSQESRDFVSVLLARPFKMFLKAISWQIGRVLYYNDNAKSFSGDFFMGQLAITGMEQSMLDEIQTQIRPKKAKVVKAKTDKKTDAAASTVPADVVAAAVAVANSSNEVSTVSTDAVAIPTTTDDILNSLVGI